MTITKELQAVVDAAREATCDTHNIPACVALGRALRVYDLARGAVCATCDGAGTIDDDDGYLGEGAVAIHALGECACATADACHAAIRGVAKARLDADGTALPKSRIVSGVHDGREGTCSASEPAEWVEGDVRIPLKAESTGDVREALVFYAYGNATDWRGDKGKRARDALNNLDATPSQRLLSTREEKPK